MNFAFTGYLFPGGLSLPCANHLTDSLPNLREEPAFALKLYSLGGSPAIA